jgi:hypothetical protein
VNPLSGKGLNSPPSDLGTAYTDNTGTAALSCKENLGIGTVQELAGGYNASLLSDGADTPVGAHAAITLGDGAQL